MTRYVEPTAGHPLACCPRHCSHPHHDDTSGSLPCSCHRPACIDDDLRCTHDTDGDGDCPSCCTWRRPTPAPPSRPLPTCGYCGKDERDGVVIGYGGVCLDCTRAWS